ncbi:ABC transporter transmembrane region [Ceratobasidium sp. AG-Ba]|nr:ABC transporter transmembrane region [Ceratobasidium sp. AG-Ba]
MADDEKRLSADHSTVASNPKRKWFGRKEGTAEKEKAVEVEAATQAEPAIPPASFTSLFRFSTPFELTLDAIGLVAAAAAGAAQPLMSLLFGRLTQSFVDFTTAIIKGNPAEIQDARVFFEKEAAKDALYLVFIGMHVSYYWMFFALTSPDRYRHVRLHIIYMYFWIYTGEVNSKRVRERYLQAVLRQDIAYFDNLGAGEVATRIQTDTHLVQQVSLKKCHWSLATSVLSSLVSSWPIFAAGNSHWHALPSCHALLSPAVSAGGGTLAEEVISTFALHTPLADKMDNKAAVFQGCGLGIFFFVIYAHTVLLSTWYNSNPPGPRSGLVPETAGPGKIELRNVKFNYPSRPDVRILKDLTLTFEAGKTAALVGASGSGKSTIIALVERFYDPLSGSVHLDGVNLKDLNVRWLRSQIGLVSQEPTLFATTIEKTSHMASLVAHTTGLFVVVSVAKKRLLPSVVVSSRKLANAPTLKQRIAIARAIVSDPKVLLLDEATSALDTQSEGIVQNALEKAAGRTTITIAHRLSTIKDADQIYVMGDGMVLEQGTHNELLRNADGPYATRRGPEAPGTPASEKAAIPSEDLEPLKRTATGSRSVASEVLSARAKEGSRYGAKDHGFTYLFKRMGLINRDSWNLYYWGCFAAIVTGMVYPAMGIVYAKAIVGFSLTDPVAKRHSGDRNALWFFIIAILSAIAIAVQNLVFGVTAARLTSKLRMMSFRAILRQDIGWFDEEKHSTGALTSTLSDNPQKVSGLAGVTLGAIVQSISCLIGGSLSRLAYGWKKLALVAIACIPLVVSAGYIRLRVVVMKDQSNKAAHEESAQVACEAAGAIKTVASLTREQDCCDIYSKSLEGPLRRSNRSALYSNAFYALSQSMIFFVIALVFWYGSKLVGSREYTTTAFFICLMSTTFGSIQAGNVFISIESPEGGKVTATRGRVVLEDVHFRYPTRPGVRVLRNLNLVVEPGTYIALVGASGSGKSTVIQLIERFYDPLAGKVTLDGQDISQLNVQEYRKNIALVSQEPTLYSGTIRFNILLGANKPHEEVTQAEIEAACRDANILDFITSLPQGFDTEVGGKGSQLSGGQKQRIAIARALLRNPKVLLLDEATSALDSTSEKVVQGALDNAAKGRTTIAIAHRLSTIQNADRIYYIKDGKVSEAGTHDELLALRATSSCNYSYELVQLQALSATS